MDVMSYRGANNDSDHNLVTVRLRARISNVKQVTGIRTSKQNVYKLTSSEVAEQYRQQIEEKLNHINLPTWTMEKNCGRDVK
jgi:beta-galactosidase GanA